jgi:DNA-binding MarR family transcriptional regulator
MANTSRNPRLRRYMRHGTLPQLAAFEAAMGHGSATMAAQALCVAQPTISGQLKKLEEALDVRLFEQRGRRLVPTGAGLAVLAAAHEISAALERCEDVLQALRPSAARRWADGEVDRTQRAQPVGQCGSDANIELALERLLRMSARGLQSGDARAMPAESAAVC